MNLTPYIIEARRSNTLGADQDSANKDVLQSLSDFSKLIQENLQRARNILEFLKKNVFTGESKILSVKGFQQIMALLTEAKGWWMQSHDEIQELKLNVKQSYQSGAFGPPNSDGAIQLSQMLIDMVEKIAQDSTKLFGNIDIMQKQAQAFEVSAGPNESPWKKMGFFIIGGLIVSVGSGMLLNWVRSGNKGPHSTRRGGSR